MIHKKYFWIILLIVNVISGIPLVNANVGPVLYVTNVRVTDPPGPGSTRIEVDWAETTGIGDVDMPIGTSGYIGLFICGSYAVAYGSQCMGLQSVKIDPGTTWRSAIASLKAKLEPTVSQNGQGWSWSDDLCGGIGVASVDNYLHETPIWTPGTICTLAAPESFSCTVQPETTTVDFGTIPWSELGGQQKTINMNTTCNGNATATISGGWGAGPLSLSTADNRSSVEVNVALDNTPLGSGISYQAINGTVSNTLSFTLQKSGATSEGVGGKQSAVALLYINFQ